MTGWPDTIWLTNQGRRDTDEAAFGEVSYDFNEKWTGTVGARYFRYDNSLRGFFGYAAGYSSNYGEALCFNDCRYHGAPCVNIDSVVKKSDTIFRGNLTYHIDDNKLIYGTWSEGFRPGGLNRNGTVGPYLPDYLTNWELGWKTTWQDNRLAFNGAVFQEDWDDIQYSFLPPSGSGLTVIRNAGNARVRGLEMDLSWAATYNFRLNGGVAFYDAELTKEYCGFNDLAGNPVTACPPGTVNPNDPLDPDDDEVVDGAQAPVGTRLPVTPRFKANATGRYAFDIGSLESYVQGSLVHVGSRPAALTREDRGGLRRTRRLHAGRFLLRRAPQQLVARLLPQERVRRTRRADPVRAMRHRHVRLPVLHRARRAAQHRPPVLAGVLSDTTNPVAARAATGFFSPYE